MQFIVETVFGVRDRKFVMVRRQAVGNFWVNPGVSRLGGALVSEFQIPRKLKPDGSPDLDSYVFGLVEPKDVENFSQGDIVVLEP
jgi:hypothetical protein